MSVPAYCAVCARADGGAELSRWQGVFAWSELADDKQSMPAAVTVYLGRGTWPPITFFTQDFLGSPLRSFSFVVRVMACTIYAQCALSC